MHENEKRKTVVVTAGMCLVYIPRSAQAETKIWRAPYIHPIPDEFDRLRAEQAMGLPVSLVQRDGRPVLIWAIRKTTLKATRKD